MQRAKTWFTKKVDSIRKELSQATVSYLVKQLKLRKELSDKKQFIKGYYSFSEGSDLSDFIERYVLNLFDKKLSGFSEHILRGGSKEDAQISAIDTECEEYPPTDNNHQVSDVVKDYQEGFLEELRGSGLTSSYLHRRKISNRVFDLLVPRVAVLGAHSQGGLTALQSMQEDNNDIGMVLGWGMPTNGVNPKRIPALWLLKKVCPMVGELITESPELKKTSDALCPIDTTVVAIDSKEEKDEIVLPNNLPSSILNAHHVSVGPKKAKATNVLGGVQMAIGYLLDYPPWFFKARAERNLYHLSYLDKIQIPYFFSGEEGSLVYEFAISENGPQNAIRLLHPSNYGVLQSNYLQWLLEKIKSKKIDPDFSSLKPSLDELCTLPLPFKGSEYELACEVKNLI